MCGVVGGVCVWCLQKRKFDLFEREAVSEKRRRTKQKKIKRAFEQEMWKRRRKKKKRKKTGEGKREKGE